MERAKQNVASMFLMTLTVVSLMLISEIADGLLPNGSAVLPDRCTSYIFVYTDHCDIQICMLDCDKIDRATGAACVPEGCQCTRCTSASILPRMRNAGARDAGPRVKKNWVAPGDGWIKINVDGAFSSTAGDGGIGVVVRDSHDTALLSSWRYIPRAKEAEEMEAMAAREGLILAAERFHHRAMLETDCSTVAIALRHRDDRRSNLKFILEEAIEAGARLPEWTAVHTRRECNSAAHELAQLARRTKHSSVWQSAMPVCIEQIIARDCNQLPE